MRTPITQTRPSMTPPSQAERADAAAKGQTPEAAEAHARYMAWEAMTTIEVAPPPATSAPGALTIAAWNIERCKRVKESATLLRRTGADILLATEVDWGMARSHQRHTTRDLAQALGMGYAFGVEFVELGTGDPYETRLYEGQPNDAGLHGNAILSRLPLENPALIPLDDGGMWYLQNPKNDGQLRIGGRMAMAAQVRVGEHLITLAAAHYESESDADGRAAQTERLLVGLDALYGPGPCIIGGDLNTNGLKGLTTGEVLQGREPSFDRFAARGFGWQTANTGRPTYRTPPGREARYPLPRLDWLFTRELAAHSPQDWPALCDRGDYLSDHELITAEVDLPSHD